MVPTGRPNLQLLIEQAQRMQQRVAHAQVELSETEVAGSAGGGLVTVTLRGDGTVAQVRIDPRVVDPEDVARLEELVSAAFGEAAEAVRAVSREKLGSLTADLGGPVL
jgi:DNA-binding YbaB/EbfC family protein